jgi:hypothetical protein
VKYSTGPKKFTAMTAAHTLLRPLTCGAGRVARSVQAVAAYGGLSVNCVVFRGCAGWAWRWVRTCGGKHRVITPIKVRVLSPA